MTTEKKLTIDQGLTDRAVQALAVIWGMSYDEAHAEVLRRLDAQDGKGDAEGDPTYPRHYTAKQWKQAHAGRRRRRSQRTHQN